MLQLTLVLSYIISLSFSSLMTNLLMFSVALLLIFSFTLLFRYFLTLILWNRFSPGNLDSMALFFWLVVHLSVPHSIALLFVISSALFFIRSHLMWHLDSITFLSWFIPALLFPDCVTGRNTTVGTPNQKQQSQYLHTAYTDDFTLPC